MFRFLRSNTFKFFAILFALLIVFCGAILLATFSAEKVAFADEIGPVYNFNQLLQNGNFASLSNWTCTRGALSLGVNSLTYTVTDNGGSAHRNRIDNSQSITFKSGHVYAFLFFLSCDYSANFHIGFNLGGTPEVYSNLQVVSSSSSNYLITVVSPLDITSNIFFALRMNASEADVGDTFLLRNFMLVDLTDLGLPSLSSYSEWHSIFPSTYYDYTTGTLISPSYDQGYEDGATYAYDLGYNAGYANGLLEVTGNTFVSDRTSWNNYASNPPFIQSGSYVVNNNHRWNVGFLDMFPAGLDYHNFAYSVNYKMGSYDGAVGHVLTFSNYAFDVIPNTTTPCIAITYSEDQFTGTVVELSLIMYEHYSDISISIVDQSTHTNTYFYPVGNLNLYAFTVYRSSNMDTVFNAGVDFGDSRLNESSVSYRTGYNRGLSTAKTATFSSLIDAVVLSPIGAVQKMLDFNVLGMNMKDFYMSIFGIAILLFIIRLFIGASGGSNG